VRKLVTGHLTSVPGLLAILITDREGVPVVKVYSQECPDNAVRPGFLGGGFNGHLAAQASKLGAGACLGMVAVYHSHQLVHHIVEELMVTLVARADSNTGHLGSLVERMKPLLQDLSRTVIEP